MQRLLKMLAKARNISLGHLILACYLVSVLYGFSISSLKMSLLLGYFKLKNWKTVSVTYIRPKISQLNFNRSVRMSDILDKGIYLLFILLLLFIYLLSILIQFNRTTSNVFIYCKNA